MEDFVKEEIQFTTDSVLPFEGIQFGKILIDTSTVEGEGSGIKFFIDVEVLASAFQNIKKEKNEGIFFELGCFGSNGKSYSCKEQVKKGTRVHANKTFFVYYPTRRQLYFQFPFRQLALEKGQQEIKIVVNAFPVKFKKDSSATDFKVIENIGKSPISFLRLKFFTIAPTLYEASIKVFKFKLNTEVVNPSKFDFSLGGSGYPDLFWQIQCGDEIIYYSPQIKNVIEYSKTHTSTNFYCTKEDIINLHVSDYDNGPFNTQSDIIETWKGKITDLSKGNKPDTLRFGNLEYFILQAYYKEKEIKPL